MITTGTYILWHTIQIVSTILESWSEATSVTLLVQSAISDKLMSMILIL